MSETFLFTKRVDYSVFYKGIGVPVAVQSTLFKCLGYSLSRGEQKNIMINLQGEKHNAILRNALVDSAKFPKRKDMVLIAWRKNVELPRKLRSIFTSTLAIVDDYRKTHRNSKSLVIPKESREYIAVYVEDNAIRFDCIPRHSVNAEPIQYDSGEDLPQKRDSISSVFQRSPEIVEQARLRAKGICQLCGKAAPFSDKEGNPYLEVHHIVWLSRDGKDTASNVIALCPNCHSKMHVVDDPNDVAILLKKANEG